MMNDHITQKLALLPEGLEEENILSWRVTTSACDAYFLHGKDNRWRILIDLIQKLSESEQTKLYRGGLSLNVLMISTKEETGLGQGDAYFYVYVKDDDVTEVGYRAIDTQKAEIFECKNDELFVEIQPLLDRLWNETRGKKNA